MGKKRPDQWQIGPDEGRVTDHKTYANEPAEADADDRRFSRVMESELDEAQPVSPKLLDPKAGARQRRSRRARHGPVR